MDNLKTPAEILSEADAKGLRRVLVVTALPLEMHAVQAHLTPIGTAYGRNGTIYECGTFAADDADWCVMVVECGEGNHASLFVVTDAHLDFGDFELVLFIGVAGSCKSDTPIGSVVAANHVYTPYTGKYGPGGFASRPRMLSIHYALVQLARKICRDNHWQARITPPLDHRLPSAEDYPQPNPPTAHVAPIVAVEAVADDPGSDLAKMIAEFASDAHGVEMEGYGAMFAADRERTPAIVIRGISDMTTNKADATDEVRQPVAAAHAAAFGFEMLNYWSVCHATRDADQDGDAERAAVVVPFDGET